MYLNDDFIRCSVRSVMLYKIARDVADQNVDAKNVNIFRNVINVCFENVQY